MQGHGHLVGRPSEVGRPLFIFICAGPPHLGLRLLPGSHNSTLVRLPQGNGEIGRGQASDGLRHCTQGVRVSWYGVGVPDPDVLSSLETGKANIPFISISLREGLPCVLRIQREARISLKKLDSCPTWQDVCSKSRLPNKPVPNQASLGVQNPSLVHEQIACAQGREFSPESLGIKSMQGCVVQGPIGMPRQKQPKNQKRIKI